MAKKRNTAPPVPIDALTTSLVTLTGELPSPRQDLTEQEKDDLVQRVGGPRTAQSIIKAKTELDPRRIPFLFSSLDTQAVVDLLANDMTAAIARALKRDRA